jgi:hypothetical protein
MFGKEQHCKNAGENKRTYEYSVVQLFYGFWENNETAIGTLTGHT